MTNTYSWDDEKDALLQEERGFGFAEIVAAVEAGGVLDDVENPSSNFPHQRALIIELHGYAVFVPYVVTEDHKFLKTAYYSRRHTKQYLNR